MDRCGSKEARGLHHHVVEGRAGEVGDLLAGEVGIRLDVRTDDQLCRVEVFSVDHLELGAVLWVTISSLCLFEGQTWV